MRFAKNKSEPQTREDSAFAERLSAIASRSKAVAELESTTEPLPRVPAIERRFWNPADLEGPDEAAAA